MDEPRLPEFYKYFQDLKEYVDLSNIAHRKGVLEPEEELKVKERVSALAVALKQFRERVYTHLHRQPEVAQKVGINASYHCSNKKCRHKFKALKHPYVKIIYNCPKCKSPTLEII